MKSTESPIPRAYWENARWAREHATELHEQYEGQWVAIADQQVIAAGSNPIDVRKRAARLTDHSTAEVFVQFMESAGTIYGTHWTVVCDMACR